MPPIAAKIITNTAPKRDAWSCEVEIVPTNNPKPVAAKPDEKATKNNTNKLFPKFNSGKPNNGKIYTPTLNMSAN